MRLATAENQTAWVREYLPLPSWLCNKSKGRLLSGAPLSDENNVTFKGGQKVGMS